MIHGSGVSVCKLRYFVLFLLMVAVFTFAFVGYYCESHEQDGWACPLLGMGTHPRPMFGSHKSIFLGKTVSDRSPSRALNSAIGYNDDAVPPESFKQYNFHQNGDDVFVFLHIQKTGGTTFGRHLVRNMRMDPPCVCFKGRKKCDCHTQNQHVWLFSRFSTGWACGLHADWTELKGCVNQHLDKIEGEHRQRRYLYITILRDPIKRYLSEWRHVSRGATWKTAGLKCNGRKASLYEVPLCFEGSNWQGVTLDGFMDCKHNLASNRQARMTANLSLVGCYNQTAMSEEQRQETILRSAIDNLAHMPFVGLTDYQLLSQYLFERTFNMKFSEDFIQINVSFTDEVKVTPEQHQRLEELNALDVKLYAYARRLFMDRVRVALLNDSRVRESLKQAGISKPEAETTETILQNIRLAELTSGRTPDPNAFWDPAFDTTSR